MKPRFPYVFLDLDGTLVDSSRDIAVSVNHVREQLGLETLPESLIQSFIGDGVEKLFARALDTSDSHRIHEAITLWRPSYETSCMVHTDFYPGIPELLTDLRRAGVTLAILTNKPQRPTEIILEGFGILAQFAAVVGGDSTPTRKPHPEMFEKALAMTGASRHEVIHIGDSHNDVKGAKNCGLHTCGVTWGYGSQHEIAEAHDIVHDSAGLRQILLQD